MVDTGTLSILNGSPVLTGQYSGFDSVAIVEATIQAKRIPAVRMEASIEENSLLSAAYGELSTLMTQLQTASNSLRNPPGFSGIDSNIFEGKSAFLTSSNSTAATELVGVTADNTAAAGTYDLEILQIAKANKLSSNSVADSTAAQGVTDTITIGLSGGTTADISITSDMTLDDIADAINGETNDTDVRASVIKVADGDYRLILTAEETGKAISLTGSSGEFLTTFGDGTSLTELQAADKAQIKLDGIATVIERDSNEISDVVEGVTFQLYKADVGNNITVEIENDLGGIKQEIVNFVDAYNAFRDLVNTNRAYDPSVEDAAAPTLFGDDLLRSADNRISGIISTGATGLDSSLLSSLGSIGISLNASNELVIDDTDLDEALVSNLEDVRNIFEFRFEPDDTRLRIVGRTQSFDVDDFELVIDGIDGSGNITGASVTGYGDVFDISGSTLKGKAGTDFEGITLVFAGTAGSGSQTIQVATSQGVAERLYQSIEDFVSPGDGFLSSRQLELTDQNSDLQDKINTIDDRLAQQRQFLLEKYSRLEQSLAQAEAMKQQLEAMANSGNN